MLGKYTDNMKDGHGYCDVTRWFVKFHFDTLRWAFSPTPSWLQKTQSDEGHGTDFEATHLVSDL